VLRLGLLATLARSGHHGRMLVGCCSGSSTRALVLDACCALLQ
jgi:hypothetical protein